MVKKCTKCGEEKELTEFYKRNDRKNGKVSRCKMCDAKRSAKYRANPETKQCRAEYQAKYNANPEVKKRTKEYSANYYAKPEVKRRRNERYVVTSIDNPEKMMWTGAMARAKKKGIEFTLELKDIVIPEYCPLSDVRLFKGDRVHHTASPSIDRIDPTKGYTKENIWVIAHRANTIKSDATSEEFMIIALNYQKKMDEINE